MRHYVLIGVLFGFLGYLAGSALADPAAQEIVKPETPAAVEPAAGGVVYPGGQQVAPEPTDPYTQQLKAIRLIEIRYLRSGKPDDFAKGREKILAITDDAAVGPLVTVLYGTNAKYRALLIEALEAHANLGSKAARAYLQEVAVGDGSKSQRTQAIGVLKRISGDKATDHLMVHLAMDEVAVSRDRAATALAELNLKQAAWLMAERLVTEEMQLAGYNLDKYDMQFDIRGQVAGVPSFTNINIQAATPGLGIATATLQLPQVQITDFKTTIGMSERHVLPDYKRIQTQHPEMLAALKKLTGKDFGYDQAAWQKWLQSPDSKMPAWEPMNLKAE